MEKTVTAAEIEEILVQMLNEKQREVLMRFFRTGPGEYGEGDRFLGLYVPQTRAVLKEAKGRIALAEIEKLLHSQWHEVRLCGFLLLGEEMKRLVPKRGQSKDLRAKERKVIADLYLANATYAHNWDLVDLSAPHVLGTYLYYSNEDPMPILTRLAESDNLWEQRISIVSTLAFIRNKEYTPALRMSQKLMNHPHHLMHKAIGWMLREIGKRDKETLLDFLENNYKDLPRTSLRYSIERFPEPERQYWLKRK